MKNIRLVCIALAFLAVPHASGQQEPVRILVAYHSITGNTEKLAQAIREGGKSVGNVQITVQKMADIKDDAILQCNGLVIGTPVHWANVSVETRQFVDRIATVLTKGKVWGEGRTAGVFCTAGNVASGKDTARISLIAAWMRKVTASWVPRRPRQLVIRVSARPNWTRHDVSASVLPA